jgi:hypothetical protein
VKLVHDRGLEAGLIATFGGAALDWLGTHGLGLLSALAVLVGVASTALSVWLRLEEHKLRLREFEAGVVARKKND